MQREKITAWNKLFSQMTQEAVRAFWRLRDKAIKLRWISGTDVAAASQTILDALIAGTIQLCFQAKYFAVWIW